VIVDEKGIKDSWKKNMEKPMNGENEWDHKILATVKEGPADCIRIDEVAAALKQMKRNKARDWSGLVAEMIQSTVDIGMQRILDLCNGIVKERCILVDWKSNMVIPIYKGKRNPMQCGSHTYAHNRFTALLDFVLQCPGQMAPER